MSEAAVEEVSVLSSIYCGEGEFQLVQQSGKLTRHSAANAAININYSKKKTTTIRTQPEAFGHAKVI